VVLLRGPSTTGALVRRVQGLRPGGVGGRQEVRGVVRAHAACECARVPRVNVLHLVATVAGL